MSNNQFKDLSFGIPKEIMQGERRVAAIPDTVKKLTEGGAKVFVEKNAGVGSYFTDEEYEKAGAIIVENVQELYNESDIILKVKEPLFNDNLEKHEVDMMHEGQILITFLHPAAPSNHEMVKTYGKQSNKSDLGWNP